MPPRSALSKLPVDVRNEVEARLRSKNFSGYEALSDDLAERGIKISKSALHRAASRATSVGSTELRLQCAEIAASCASPQDLIELAERIEAWVLQGQ
jgi:HPt (histidine-containing phosphotransfer) domain-containing protein